MSEHLTQFHPILSPGESQVASKNVWFKTLNKPQTNSKHVVRWKAFTYDMMHDIMLEGSIRKISVSDCWDKKYLGKYLNIQ